MMLIECKCLFCIFFENNFVVININMGIEFMWYNVQIIVNSVLRGLQIVQFNFECQVWKFEGRISSVLQQEKEFFIIFCQQEIKVIFYIMLFQKCEENVIILVFIVNNGCIIKVVFFSKKLVFFKKKIVLLVVFVLGMGIFVGFIYLKDLLKYKIENVEDVEKIMDVFILGEFFLSKKFEKGVIVVQENQNGMMEEVFCGLCINMLFMFGVSQKVVFFIFIQLGEGKFFIVGNMVVSLVYMGKKVVIVGLDICKLGLNKVFNLFYCMEGIINYLVDFEYINFFDMI